MYYYKGIINRWSIQSTKNNHPLDPDSLENRMTKCPAKYGLENSKWFCVQKSSSCQRANYNKHMESVESKGQ